jgi:S-(hydroxymethyl)glutathione dehydrogenase/alcohol dehydrogenase
MKAAVCYEFGKPLVVEEVDLDPPEEGEVKVRISATAVCHSDIHCIKGELPGKLPGVPGHESAGYVEEVGPNVTEIKPGDPVIISTVTTGCGQCYYCNIGLRHLCERRSPMKPHHRNKDGVPMLPMAGPVGGFSEYTVVSETQVAVIPEDLPMDRAALISCGVLTGYGAVVNRAKVEPLKSVVVMGTGGVGLNAIQAAALVGANPVIAVDILDKKLDFAKSFGATHGVNSATEQDPIAKIIELTHGRGADYVFVTVGNVKALRQGFDMAGPRGMTVIIGLVPMKDTISFNTFDFLGGEKVLTACGGGSPRLRIDVQNIIELYREGRLKLDELITAYYPLEKINEAIASSATGEAIRNIIMFE